MPWGIRDGGEKGKSTDNLKFTVGLLEKKAVGQAQRNSPKELMF